MTRRPGWRWLGAAGVVALAAILIWSIVLLLGPAEQQVQAQTVEASVYVHDGVERQAVLVRQGDRWVGHVADFPPGSIAHVQPRGGPGFFLVRDPGGVFRALSDRSPYRGQPLELRDPLPGTANHAGGPLPGFYDAEFGANHTLDGEPLAGPAPRPLDPFPVAVEGHRLEIAIRARCPPDLGVPPAWCGADDGPRTLAAGQVAILLPPGSQLRILGGPAAGSGRTVSDQELRGWGAEVVHSVPELEQLAAAGARVLWLHEDALPLVDPAWIRSQHEQGRAIGVLDGTMTDLGHWFGLGDNSPSWIQPGTGRPVFAQVQAQDASGRQQRSDWLTLSWLLTASQAPLAAGSECCAASATVDRGTQR